MEYQLKSTLVARLRAMETALSVSDLAELLSMGRNTMHVWVRSGKVPSYKIGNTIRIDPIEAADWLESRRMAA